MSERGDNADRRGSTWTPKDQAPRPFAPVEGPLDTGASGQMALQALEAQAALLPYALALFGVALPIFAWVCSFAPNRLWMTSSLLIFAINWAAFYAIFDAGKKSLPTVSEVKTRARVHVLGGLLWAGAVMQISVMGLGAGPAREGMEMLAVGGASACIFLSAPYLPALLIVGPAAGVGPLLALYSRPDTRPMGQLALGALALVMALSLMFNRLLRRQFTLAADREALVDERARSLIRAEALMRSKSDLITILSNEIRNGLTGVTHVLAAAASAGGRGGPSRDQMASALASARDLIEALNATLDSEAAEAGRLSLEPRPFDAAQVVREVVAGFRPMATAKGLELSVHIDEAIEHATGATVGDPARCRQILSNLIANAIKYTVRGRVEVRTEPLGDRHLRFEVADTGPGLTAAEIAQAFAPFKRVARTAAGVSGAGLGLSLSRRLAQLMEGEVSAESATGVGSCFRLDLPYDPAASALPTPAVLALDASASATEPAGQPLRVLSVDDNALAAAMLRAVLEQLGHRVLHAGDGQRALDLAQTCDVDLIIMSARLPGLDGPDLVRAIRGLSRPIAEAPIITLIDGDADEARACRQAGADQILRRPVTVGTVARAIAAAIVEDQPHPLKIAGRR